MARDVNSVGKRVAQSNMREQARVSRKYDGVKKFSEGVRPETQDEYDDPIYDSQTSRFHPENLADTPKQAVRDAIASIKSKQKKIKK